MLHDNNFVFIIRCLWWRVSVNTADILLGVVKLQDDRYIQDAFITFFKIRITTYKWGDIFGAGFGGFEDSEFLGL